MNLNTFRNRKQTDISYLLTKHRTRFQLTRYCIRNCLASVKNCLLPFTVKQTKTNLFKLLVNEQIRISLIRYGLFRGACFAHLLLTKTQKGHFCKRLFLKKKVKHAPPPPPLFTSRMREMRCDFPCILFLMSECSRTGKSSLC